MLGDLLMSEVLLHSLFSHTLVGSTKPQWRGAGARIAYNASNNDIYSSTNISSVSDDGTGYATFYFSIPFTSVDYTMTGMASERTTAITAEVAGTFTVAPMPASDTRLEHTTAYMQVHTSDNNTDTERDAAYLLLSFHGARL